MKVTDGKEKSISGSSEKGLLIQGLEAKKVGRIVEGKNKIEEVIRVSEN